MNIKVDLLLHGGSKRPIFQESAIVTTLDTASPELANSAIMLGLSHLLRNMAKNADVMAAKGILPKGRILSSWETRLTVTLDYQLPTHD
jgi:hypothetical protein